MSHFELITLGIFDVFAYLFLTLGFLKKEKISNRNKIFFIFFAFINLSIITIILPREHTFLFNFISFYLGTYLFLSKKWLDSLLIFSMNMTMQTFITLPVVVILNIMYTDVQTNYMLGLVLQSISICIFYIIYKRAGLDILWEYIIRNYKIFLIVIINMMLIGFSIIVFYSLDVERFTELIIFFLTISLVVLSVNIVLIHQAIKNKNQEDMIKKHSEYQDMITSLIEEIKLVQHEYDNHIQALQMVMKNDDPLQKVGTQNYILEIEQKQWFRNILKTTHPVLLGLLITKYKKAKERNIHLEVDNQSIEMQMPVKDFELTEMLGILTDNAIKNTVDGGTIKIDFYKDGFLVKNTHDYLPADQVKDFFKKGYSTRKSSGLGLYNLKHIVKKYNGEVEVYNEKWSDENFVVFRVSFT